MPVVGKAAEDGDTEGAGFWMRKTAGLIQWWSVHLGIFVAILFLRQRNVTVEEELKIAKRFSKLAIRNTLSSYPCKMFDVFGNMAFIHRELINTIHDVVAVHLPAYQPCSQLPEPFDRKAFIKKQVFAIRETTHTILSQS